jgi:hypothetical protein
MVGMDVMDSMNSLGSRVARYIIQGLIVSFVLVLAFDMIIESELVDMIVTSLVIGLLVSLVWDLRPKNSWEGP